MAEQEQDGTAEDGKKSSGGMTKIIILALLGLVLVGASVGGTLFFLGFFDSDDQAGSETTEAAESIEVKQVAIYFPIKPPFIINYQVRGRQRFLQVSVTVMSREQDTIDAIQTHIPLIKNRLVMLFSGEVYEELHTDEGRELLRQKTLSALQEILEQEIGKPGVEQVLFENFVMQ